MPEVTWRAGRRALALAAAVSLSALAAGCGSGSGTAVTSQADSPVPTSLPSRTPTTPTTQAVVLPVPVVPPDPNSAEPEVSLGTIEIPKLGLRYEMDEGITLGTLARGPGHWPGSALPGQVGNVVVAGHRVTHTHPFRDIDKLVVGDEVIFQSGGNRFVYRMTSSEIVPPTGIHIIDQTTASTATLFACHPPGSAAYRYVVHLELVT